MKDLGARIGEWWSEDKTRRQGELFGLGMGMAMSIMAAISMFRGMPARMEILAMISATLLGLAFILPRPLAAPAWLVEQVFLLLARSLLVFTLVSIFALIFAPAGIALRLLRKDPLNQKLEPGAESYWLPRRPTDPARAEKQF